MAMKLVKPPLPDVAWYPEEEFRKFQQRHGIWVDGIASKQTMSTLRDIEERADTRRIRRYSYGGAPIKDGIDRDPNHLLTGFADTIEELFQRMRARGFSPLLWEAVRSEERARELAARGTGSSGLRSMHLIGAAVDVIDTADYWRAPPEFWRALGEEAERLSLTWGGRWPRQDKPHVQLVRVSEQDEFRAMTPEQRERRAKVA